jgi:hypothetical protein
MKDRMMTLIPKKSGDPTLDNLRPIGLLEILRKLWARIETRLSTPFPIWVSLG